MCVLLDVDHEDGGVGADDDDDDVVIGVVLRVGGQLCLCGRAQTREQRGFVIGAEVTEVVVRGGKIRKRSYMRVCARFVAGLMRVVAGPLFAAQAGAEPKYPCCCLQQSTKRASIWSIGLDAGTPA